MAVLVVAAAVGVAATGGRGADKPTRVVVAPAIRAVSSAVAATVTGGRDPGPRAVRVRRQVRTGRAG